MRRRATFSWEAHWREQYATGKINLPEFERLIMYALVAERAPRPTARRPARTAKDAAREWSAVSSAHAANYAAGISAVAREDSRIHTASHEEKSPGAV